MKQLENAREYKKLSKLYSSNTSIVTKALEFLKRLLSMSKTIMECDEQKGFQILSAFNEFEVLGGGKQKDTKDKTILQGSHQVKVLF